MIRRREVIAGIGGAAAWSLVARAQRSGVPVVGFLQGQTIKTAMPLLEAFRRGLAESGYIDGQNVVVEYRLANGQPERVPALAAELVNRRVDVLASGYQTARAAKNATTTIPIVFMGGTDPVRTGLVATINRPGGNITGVSIAAADLLSKRIGLLRELVPQAAVIGALVDSGGPQADVDFQLQELNEQGRRLGRPVRTIKVSKEADFDGAFSTLAREGIGAIIIAPSILFNSNPEALVASATRHRIPTVYELREFVVTGGLMSYAPSLTDAFRQGGMYTARVLRGEKPAEMPVMLPAKFEFVLNLKTAEALGLTIPPGVLAIADEVIE